MKRRRVPKICEVKIYGRNKLPAIEPKTCEVKIYGKEERRTRKYYPTVAGINQIVAQVTNKLSRRTRSFKDGGGVLMTLPEWQTVRKMPEVFKILLTQGIYKLAPGLRREEFTLQLEGFKILFIPGARDF